MVVSPVLVITMLRLSGGGTVRALTEKQYRRREKILAAARDLITQHGYEGVTMRELAARANVTPKTLYHQFGNKEKLLRTAVEERFRHTYQAIDDHQVKKGIGKLYFVIDSVADSTRKNLQYARALAPLLVSRARDPFIRIRLDIYRNALQQIDDEGDLVNWVDLGVWTHMVYRNVQPLYLNWYGDASGIKPEEFTKYNISLALATVTTGYTHQEALKTVKSLQKNLLEIDHY